jgi:predicted O-linked N-acetylglucosamine transferase (SPINDLY family)
MFDRAVKHHRAGQREKTEKSCRIILMRDPAHAGAMNLLSVIERGKGNPQLACDWSKKALAIEPAAELHLNLGRALLDLHQSDRAAEAFAQAVAAKPAWALAHADLSAALCNTGRLDESLAAARRALQLEPANARFHFIHGTALLALKRLEEAAEVYGSGLHIQPDAAEARIVLGRILQDLGQLEEAADQFRMVLKQEAGSVQAAANLAKVLKSSGKIEEATALLYEWAQHWTTQARGCRERHDRAGEMQALIRALQLEPHHPTAQTGLSGLLLQFPSPEEAEAVLFDSLKKMSAPPATLGLLGNVLKEIGYVNLALECYTRGLDLVPNHSAGSNFIYALLFDQWQDDGEVAEQHREWARNFAQPHYPVSPRFENNRDVNRVLRVGYVSGHFHDHAVAFFSLPMLQAHHPDQVEIFCYDNTGIADDHTEVFRACASVWRDITNMDDDAAAAVIKDDAIDILVDLAGHIAGNRILIFARKPAPIQVTYLGYQATTGMTVMDYRLTDAIADPPRQCENLYTEKLVRLQPGFFVYQPSSYAPPVAAPPLAKNGFITFGCFNNPTKISAAATDLWSQLLREIPTAHLLVLGPTSHDGDPRLARMFELRGIDHSRLHFVGKCARRAYLERYANVDIALDPFPFSGHTTTCDALWQGVPVITLAGRTYAGRMSASTLHQANLGHLVANSTEEYLRIAIALASDQQALTELRQTMRQRLRAAPILDADKFVRSLERAYRQMWRDWCEHQ